MDPDEKEQPVVEEENQEEEGHDQSEDYRERVEDGITGVMNPSDEEE